MREVASIALRHVELSGSRPTIPDTVNAMSQSLSQIGLISPITVIPAKVFDGSIFVDGYRVIAGNHRVAAARALGWKVIEAFVSSEDDRLDNELREIDENLCRAELTPAQRAYAIKRRKEIWEARNPNGVVEAEQFVPPQDGKHGGARPQKKEFAADTAAVTGQSKQDINRHVSRAEALGDDLLEVTGTSLDKGVELDALKSLPEAERKDLIAKAKAGEKVSARKASLSDDGIPPAVLIVVRQLDIMSMILSNAGITVSAFADQFIAEFDPSDKASSERVLAILPLLDALSRIAAEADAGEEGDL